MTGSEQIILIIMAYISTGIGLIGYDFATPLSERKAYIREGNLKAGLSILFFWPATIMFDVFGIGGACRQTPRFLLSAFMLVVTMYFCAMVIFLLSRWLVSINWIAFTATAIVLFIVNPMITALTLPHHAAPESK
jgi:hypothetical protein